MLLALDELRLDDSLNELDRSDSCELDDIELLSDIWLDSELLMDDWSDGDELDVLLLSDIELDSELLSSLLCELSAELLDDIDCDSDDVDSDVLESSSGTPCGGAAKNTETRFLQGSCGIA